MNNASQTLCRAGRLKTSDGGRLTAREDLKSKRDAILEIAQSHGVSRVRVFGSVARGSERSDSDVDILVSTQTATLFDIAAMEEELERLLGRRVQVVCEGGLKPRVKDSILREAVAV